MSVRLYNTLTQQVEPLRPLQPPQVRMYTCGPTVYHHVHIGNFRTFVFQDVLRRWIRYRGFDLKHVMNITDVEDKIIENARQEGLSIRKYTEKFSRAFQEDMQTLRIQEPDLMPRATDHIDDMVKLVEQLQEKGATYESDGSIYFRIDSFPEYGKLAHLEPSDIDGVGREDSDEYDKENPRDFALWKARRPGEEFWSTSLGEGRPGWHLECSAMSMKYLGESFDIHCGGVDLVFPHHENEIAQSEAATGKPFVRHWVHGAHLVVEGEKMSKSKGNFHTLRDLLDRGCSPVALRYLLQSVHYRKQLNFTFRGLEQAASALQRVDDFLQKVRHLENGLAANPEISDKTRQARESFEAAMDDDLNTSEALAALFELIRETNIALDNRRLGDRNRDDILQLFADADKIFDTFQVEEVSLDDEEILSAIEERKAARLNRQYERADRIRDELARRGIILEDTKEGTRWKQVH